MKEVKEETSLKISAPLTKIVVEFRELRKKIYYASNKDSGCHENALSRSKSYSPRSISRPQTPEEEPSNHGASKRTDGSKDSNESVSDRDRIASIKPRGLGRSKKKTPAGDVSVQTDLDGNGSNPDNIRRSGRAKTKRVADLELPKHSPRRPARKRKVQKIEESARPQRSASIRKGCIEEASNSEEYSNLGPKTNRSRPTKKMPDDESDGDLSVQNSSPADENSIISHVILERIQKLDETLRELGKSFDAFKQVVEAREAKMQKNFKEMSDRCQKHH